MPPIRFAPGDRNRSVPRLRTSSVTVFQISTSRSTSEDPETPNSRAIGYVASVTLVANVSTSVSRSQSLFRGAIIDDLLPLGRLGQRSPRTRVRTEWQGATPARRSPLHCPNDLFLFLGTDQGRCNNHAKRSARAQPRPKVCESPRRALSENARERGKAENWNPQCPPGPKMCPTR